MNGLYDNWELVEALWSHAFRFSTVVPMMRGPCHSPCDADLSCSEPFPCAAHSERLRIDPRDQPLMLAEPSFQPREARERVVTRVFEGCSAPALFLAKNAALSSYATGRQTSLVVDMGHEGTVGARPPLLPQLVSAHTRNSPHHLLTWLTDHCNYTAPSRMASGPRAPQEHANTTWHVQRYSALKSAASLLQASAAVSVTSAGCPRWL